MSSAFAKAQLLRDLSIVDLAARDPTILSANGDHLCLANPARRKSWMRRTGNISPQYMLGDQLVALDSASLHLISIDQSPSSEFIQLPMLILSVSIELASPAEDLRDRARRFFDSSSRSANSHSGDRHNGSMRRYFHERSSREPYIRDLRIETLACIAECSPVHPKSSPESTMHIDEESRWTNTESASKL